MTDTGCSPQLLHDLWLCGYRFLRYEWEQPCTRGNSQERAGDEAIVVCARKLMRHAQEGAEMGIGCREGAVGVLKHANSQTDDTDGSTTAVIAVMHPPNVCEVKPSGSLLSAASPPAHFWRLPTAQILGAMR